ncbi:Free methionine-R-sulfoxide reductase [Beauveria bassiana]|nr:Free methionine-R-sulfoxide reductase [Beauveria bassiana]
MELTFHSRWLVGGVELVVYVLGFYVLDPSSAKPQLILGPFQGKVACQIIAFGRGVCGVAAESQTTQLVQDVEQFPGHIACDSESKSEIVVPIVAVKDGAKKVVAIIDVDCAELHGFDEVDKKNLEQLAELIGKKWSISNLFHSIDRVLRTRSKIAGSSSLAFNAVAGARRQAIFSGASDESQVAKSPKTVRFQAVEAAFTALMLVKPPFVCPSHPFSRPGRPQSQPHTYKGGAML